VAEERIQLEIGFEGGQIVGAIVVPAAADALREALARGTDGTFELEAEDGTYLVPLRKVVYAKRFSRDNRIGFGRAG
jgi:hypothetical protein